MIKISLSSGVARHVQLKEMRSQLLEPDAVSYSAAISSCAQGKYWKKALELLEDCKMWATPDTISYSAAIVATMSSKS